MSVGVARVVSFVFHPLLMATYLFSLLLFLFPVALLPIQATLQPWFVLFIFAVSFLLPGLAIGIFKMRGSVKTLTMYNRRERIVPFFYISVHYLAFTYLFYANLHFGLNDHVFKFMLIMDGLVFISTIITCFYKLSIHSVAICGLLGILLPLNKVSEQGQLLVPTVAIILVAGLVMSSRLKLNAHTPREILVGSLTGLATGFFGMVVLF